LKQNFYLIWKGHQTGCSQLFVRSLTLHARCKPDYEFYQLENLFEYATRPLMWPRSFWYNKIHLFLFTSRFYFGEKTRIKIFDRYRLFRYNYRWCRWCRWCFWFFYRNTVAPSAPSSRSVYVHKKYCVMDISFEIYMLFKKFSLKLFNKFLY
jgi:hypothetical protein